MSVVVELTKGYTTIIDDEDYERVSAWSWCISFNDGRPYAVRGTTAGGKQARIYLHRFLMDAPPGVEVDHKNRLTLDNRRSCNLRLVTSSQNKMNSGPREGRKYKGVERMGKAYYACTRNTTRGVDRIRRGPFATAEEAARAYDVLVREVHGEFAYVNFPEEALPIAEQRADNETAASGPVGRSPGPARASQLAAAKETARRVDVSAPSSAHRSG